VGVLVKSFTADAYTQAARELAALLREPGTQQRCRSLAERQFGLDSAVDRYYLLYQELNGSRR
jgi:hypothetical protein